MKALREIEYFKYCFPLTQFGTRGPWMDIEESKVQTGRVEERASRYVYEKARVGTSLHVKIITGSLSILSMLSNPGLRQHDR